MGIQGIYRELGPGQRVAVSKLAADSLAQSNRPLRIAIDIAIWQYQIQSGKGGFNPAIRTLFYRLTRLMRTPIEPLFVFDGPKKPSVKRNKRSGRGDGVAVAQAKRLISLFGFAIHDAPGEAEAECALLQRHGIVDAVLSEDVDTIMFGSTKTLRNWSTETKSSSAPPTHVSLYDTEDPAIAKVGLTREGMVLIALMSGGDYLPEGIPGCGIKVAYEAAKAGFGMSVCRLRVSDHAGISAWKESLVHELRTNESKFFRTRHKALEIPDSFPNLEVLGCYTHPVVSPVSTLDEVRRKMDTRKEFRLEELREFTRENFDWDYLGGAIKFIRVLGEPLLVHKISRDASIGDRYVKKISRRRNHPTTDGSSELRLSYVPHDVVPIDISNEKEEEISFDREGLALNSDEEVEEMPDLMDSTQGPRARTYKEFDITKPQPTWVLEEVARKAIPDALKAWEDGQQAKAAGKSPNKKSKGRTTAAGAKKSGAVQFGAMSQFVRTTKASAVQDGLARKAKNASDRPALTLPSSQPSAPHSPPPQRRQPSKQPTDPSTRTGAGIFAGLQDTPRATSKSAGRQQTISIFSSPVASGSGPILISSSPPAAAPASPSARPRTRCPSIGATDGSSPLPTMDALYGASQAVRSPCRGRATAATPKGSSSPFGSSPFKFKQTSIDAFAKRLYPPTKPLSPVLDLTSEDEAGPIYDEDNGMGGFIREASISGLVTDLTTPDSQTSSKKRFRTHVAGPDSSPSPARPRKKILVPIDGYFQELEVDEASRDEHIVTQTRVLKAKGVRAKVLRWSDLTMVDLTAA